MGGAARYAAAPILKRKRFSDIIFTALSGPPAVKPRGGAADCAVAGSDNEGRMMRLHSLLA